MKVSVIIPTYKPQSYIWECFESLKNQTFEKSEYELIIVLNGCKDPYYSQITKYLSKYFKEFNVVFIQTDKGGVSHARNVALDAAKGEYITFVDDDDYVSPNYLAEMYKKADKETIALSNTIVVKDIKEDVWDCTVSMTETFKKKCVEGKQSFFKVKKYFSGPVMKLIHRNIIGDRRFDDNFQIGEDSQFMFLISDRIKYVDFTSEQAIYYRRLREGSAVTSLKYEQRLLNVMKMIPAYTRVFVKGFPHYNFYFFITRILGTIHSLI